MECINDKKQIKINLFGIMRERVNSNSLILSIDNNNTTTIKELKKLISEAHPTLELDSKKVVFAFNKRICHNENIVVNSDDEISILPPISGG